jgi:hypothetical protein
MHLLHRLALYTAIACIRPLLDAEACCVMVVTYTATPCAMQMSDEPSKLATHYSIGQREFFKHVVRSQLLRYMCCMLCGCCCKNGV